MYMYIYVQLLTLQHNTMYYTLSNISVTYLSLIKLVKKLS